MLFSAIFFVFSLHLTMKMEWEWKSKVGNCSEGNIKSGDYVEPFPDNVFIIIWIIHSVSDGKAVRKAEKSESEQARHNGKATSSFWSIEKNEALIFSTSDRFSPIASLPHTTDITRELRWDHLVGTSTSSSLRIFYLDSFMASALLGVNEQRTESVIIKMGSEWNESGSDFQLVWFAIRYECFSPRFSYN